MKSEIELLNEVVEFNIIHEFMSDEQVDRILEVIVKAIHGEELPQQAIPDLIVELQALTSKFAILATYYSGVGKSGRDEVLKKNIYYTLKESTGDLVQALKYKARGGFYG